MPLHLERHLRRRAAAPPLKRRPVTLQELIDQLQQMAVQLGETPLPPRVLRPRSQSRSQAAKAIAHLAHDENLTEIATRLEVFLSRHWQEISAGKDWLNLDQLLEWWTLSPIALDKADSLASLSGTLAGNGNSEQDSHLALGKATSEGLYAPSHEAASHEAAVEATEDGANDRVGVFWALLLLSAQSKVELSQEEFYQDLKIRAL